MRRRLPPLNALKAFEATARLGSFKAAADELLVSSGAVSRHIVNLEWYLGLDLFWRRHSEIGLTAAGESTQSRFFERYAHEHETQRMVQIANPKKLRVRTGPTFAHCWLAPRLAEFCSENPQIDLLVTTNVGEVISSEDHFDVAIHMMHDPLTGDSESCESEIMAVCHPRRLRSNAPLRQPQDIARHTLLHSLNRMTYWRQWFRAAGLNDGPFEVGPKFKSSILAYEAAKGDLGFVCAEPSFIASAVANGELASV